MVEFEISCFIANHLKELNEGGEIGLKGDYRVVLHDQGFGATINNDYFNQVSNDALGKAQEAKIIEIDIGSVEDSKSTTIADFHNELTKEGEEVEQKLDILSQNLRGNRRKFEFSQPNLISKKSLGTSIDPMSSENQTESQSSPTKTNEEEEEKKNDMRIPEVQETSSQDQGKEITHGEEKFKLPNKGTKKKGPKRELFIFGGETASTNPMSDGDPVKSMKIKDNQEEQETQLENKIETNSGDNLYSIESEVGRSTTNKFKKTKLKFEGSALNLDIEAINEEFDFGGEEGRKIGRSNEEDLLQEIKALAEECVCYMSKRRSKASLSD